MHAIKFLTCKHKCRKIIMGWLARTTNYQIEYTSIFPFQHSHTSGFDSYQRERGGEHRKSEYNSESMIVLYLGPSGHVCLQTVSWTLLQCLFPEPCPRSRSARGRRLLRTRTGPRAFPSSSVWISRHLRAGHGRMTSLLAIHQIQLSQYEYYYRKSPACVSVVQIALLEGASWLPREACRPLGSAPVQQNLPCAYTCT